MALTYERTDFPVDRRLNAVKFKRRSRGRPRSIGLAAARTRDEGPALESEDDSEGGEGGDPQPVGGRGGGAIPGRARGRGRGPRRARGTGAGSQTRDQGPEDDADPEGGVMEDPQPGGSRDGGADLEFVKKFTRPNFPVKEFYTLKTRKSRLFSPTINSKNTSLSVIWPSFG